MYFSMLINLMFKWTKQEKGSLIVMTSYLRTAQKYIKDDFEKKVYEASPLLRKTFYKCYNKDTDLQDNNTEKTLSLCGRSSKCFFNKIQ